MSVTEERVGDHLYAPVFQREKPWLLPYNRRLRHLRGITIRGLTFTPPIGRSRGKTIDDAAIPSTLRSPGKVLAQRESKKLEHSRSSSDLRASNDIALHSALVPRDGEEQPLAKRPSVTRARRRSTMEWSDASPIQRQKKLEDVATERMVDSFFSLHVLDQADPIYISEVVEKAMNPNFRFFDLLSYGPTATRLDTITVKVWTKNGNMNGYQHLIELTINLRFLQFIGKSLEHFHHPLPPNSIIFHLEDGVYTSFTDMPSDESLNAHIAPLSNPIQSSIQTTSSYDALMRLSTLDDCIQDALNTRARLTDEIENILRKNKDSLVTVNSVPEAQERLRSVELSVETQKRRIEITRKKRSELIASIKARKEAMRIGREAQTQSENDLSAAREKLDTCKKTLLKTQEDMSGQRRRICEELLSIYPIEPVPGKTLSFTIRGLHLPNSDSDDSNEDIVAAALGHASHVVYLLSFYLSHPLPYPVYPHSSTSTIQDPISLTTGSRIYPLFTKGVIRYRFEYGVFLLNKNIEMLATKLGLKVIDIRQTLPNLKYLLYVATAGQGELPVRKAGGVRGLLRRGDERSLSRRASQDSTSSSIEEPKTSIDGKLGLLSSNQDTQGDVNGTPSLIYGSSKRGIPVRGSKLKEVLS